MSKYLAVLDKVGRGAEVAFQRVLEAQKHTLEHILPVARNRGREVGVGLGRCRACSGRGGGGGGGDERSVHAEQRAVHRVVQQVPHKRALELQAQTNRKKKAGWAGGGNES